MTQWVIHLLCPPNSSHLRAVSEGVFLPGHSWSNHSSAAAAGRENEAAAKLSQALGIWRRRQTRGSATFFPLAVSVFPRALRALQWFSGPTVLTAIFLSSGALQVPALLLLGEPAGVLSESYQMCYQKWCAPLLTEKVDKPLFRSPPLPVREFYPACLWPQSWLGMALARDWNQCESLHPSVLSLWVTNHQ